jgi:hypothetical protein
VTLMVDEKAVAGLRLARAADGDSGDTS